MEVDILWTVAQHWQKLDSAQVYFWTATKLNKQKALAAWRITSVMERFENHRFRVSKLIESGMNLERNIKGQCMSRTGEEWQARFCNRYCRYWLVTFQIY